MPMREMNELRSGFSYDYARKIKWSLISISMAGYIIAWCCKIDAILFFIIIHHLLKYGDNKDQKQYVPKPKNR